MRPSFANIARVKRLPESLWLIEYYISDQPIFALTQRFIGQTQEPCVTQAWDYKTRYYGTGVPPHLHPHTRPEAPLLRTITCKKCQSHNVLVLMLEVEIRLRNGDINYILEVQCQDCHTYTAVIHDDV